VGGNAELFSEARDAVDKASLNILAAQFKAKAFDLDRLKRTYKALGPDTLSLVLEHLPDTLPKALVSRMDPYYPHATDGAASKRSHLVALASGAAKPEAKPEQPVKKKAASVNDKIEPKSKDDSIAESFWATSVMAKPQRSSKTRRSPK
jgi:hypothetical protein